MTDDLRPYQTAAVEALRASVASGHRAPILVASCGSGKTIIAKKIIDSATNGKGRKVLFLAPRRELIFQCAEKLDRAGIEHGLYMAGERRQMFAPVQVASIPTLYSRMNRGGPTILPEADLVIIDECFGAGTKVDGRNIEDITPGDVLSTGRVVAVSKRRAKSLVRLAFCDGREIICTPNHPFFTDRGWVAAVDLKRYHKMVSIRGYHHGGGEKFREDEDQGLSAVREFFSASGQTAPEDVFAGMFVPMETGSCTEELGEICQNHTGQADERKQPDEGPSGPQAGQYDLAGDGLGADQTGGQRAGGNGPRKTSRVCVGVGDEPDCSHGREEGQRLPDPLQGGFGERGIEGRDRSGWPVSSSARSAETGQEEGKVFEIARVDSVEIYERGSGSQFEQMCSGGLVYNLQIDKTGVYFAEGVLVHNCHLAVAKATLAVLGHYPGAVKIGLTATPCRQDGRGLGEIFDDLVFGPSMQELIDGGWLVPARYFAPSKPDLEGVKIQMGDYNQKQLGKRVNDPVLVGGVVENWLRIGEMRQTIVFAVNVAHSIHLRDQFRKVDILADHIDAKTPNDERRDILRRFDGGDVNVLVNCQIVGYGVDIPPASCCILAHPTKSLTRYLQAAGRVLRPYEGKTDALIIDHSGIVETLGFIDDDHPWSLDGNSRLQDRRAEREREAGEPKALTCSECATVFRGRPTCPHCGKNMALTYARAIEERDAELEEIDRLTKARTKREWSPYARECFYRELVGYGMAKSYKPGWASHKYRERFGVWPADGMRNGPLELTPSTRSWITSRNIAAAKMRRREKERAGGQPA